MNDTYLIYKMWVQILEMVHPTSSSFPTLPKINLLIIFIFKMTKDISIKSIEKKKKIGSGVWWSLKTSWTPHELHKVAVLG
jgi:hypothetical protein